MELEHTKGRVCRVEHLESFGAAGLAGPLPEARSQRTQLLLCRRERDSRFETQQRKRNRAELSWRRDLPDAEQSAGEAGFLGQKAHDHTCVAVDVNRRRAE